MERAHVVQPVGELHEQHAHVVGDRKQELAQIFRLLGFLGDEIELLQLGQALDQRTDLLAEQLVDFRARRRRILDGVVQECSRDRRVVELEVGQDRRDFERMREIGIAGGALLLAMLLHRVDVGAVEQRFVRIRVVAADAVDQFVLPHHLRLGGPFLLVDRDRKRSRHVQRGAGARLVLHPRQLGVRSRHIRSGRRRDAALNPMMLTRCFSLPARLRHRVKKQKGPAEPGLRYVDITRVLFLFFRLRLWGREALQTLQKFLLAHVFHGDVGVVGIDRARRSNQRRLRFRLINLDIFLQRVNQVFFQVLRRDRGLGNLAQCNHRVLVVVAIDGNLRSGRHHARAVARKQNEFKSIFDLIDTIFDGDAGHWLGTPQSWVVRLELAQLVPICPQIRKN